MPERRRRFLYLSMSIILATWAPVLALQALDEPTFVVPSKEILPGVMTMDAALKLTPLQQRQLTEAQLTAIESEMERNSLDTEKLVKDFIDDSVSSGSVERKVVWPNYEWTLNCAIGMGYRGYLAQCYKKIKGPDWTDDGCSVPGSKVFPFIKIFNGTACRHHDFSYRNLSKYDRGHTGKMRGRVDRRLYVDMVRVCKIRYHYLDPRRYSCRVAALSGWVIVAAFAESSWNDTKPRYP